MADARSFAVQEALRDGTIVVVRAAKPADRDRIATAFRQLERSSVYTRFFTFKEELGPRDLAQLDAMDFVHDVMLLVTIGSGDAETVIASGRYVGLDARSAAAEVAFTVEEDWQGRGIASRLLRHLTAIARGFGLRTFEADVLAENAPMLAVFARSGLPLRQTRDGGVIHVALDLTPHGAAEQPVTP